MRSLKSICTFSSDFHGFIYSATSKPDKLTGVVARSVLVQLGSVPQCFINMYFLYFSRILEQDKSIKHE